MWSSISWYSFCDVLCLTGYFYVCALEQIGYKSRLFSDIRKCGQFYLLFRIVFWDVLPCKITVDRLFRCTYCLHHQVWGHGSTSQKTILNFILAAVRKWNLTILFFVSSIFLYNHFLARVISTHITAYSYQSIQQKTVMVGEMTLTKSLCRQVALSRPAVVVPVSAARRLCQ
jgi:hypothetical protein